MGPSLRVAADQRVFTRAGALSVIRAVWLVRCRAWSTSIRGPRVRSLQSVRYLGVWMSLTCGIDWAEGHHDVAVVGEAGQVVAERRIGVGATGFADLLKVLAECGECT